MNPIRGFFFHFFLVYTTMDRWNHEYGQYSVLRDFNAKILMRFNQTVVILTYSYAVAVLTRTSLCLQADFGQLSFDNNYYYLHAAFITTTTIIIMVMLLLFFRYFFLFLESGDRFRSCNVASFPAGRISTRLPVLFPAIYMDGAYTYRTKAVFGRCPTSVVHRTRL